MNIAQEGNKFKNIKINLLNDFLIKTSKEICQDNDCSDENHNCESYAYITRNYDLIDVCKYDYFQGSIAPTACILLPWEGKAKELKEEIDNQIEEQNYEY